MGNILNQESIESVAGAEIEKASSSLNMFAIAFTDGRGLMLKANQDEEDFVIDSELTTKEKLPELAEAVCTVDWTWIENTTINTVKAKDNLVEFKLNPVGPLVIGLGAWEGKPFLSFQPFRPAKK